MSNDQAIIAVTGGNRGIGFEVCRQLAERGARVILTARSRMSGEQAARDLHASGLSVDFHQLEVSDAHSIDVFAGYVQSAHGRLDALINNAGVLPAGNTGAVSVDLEEVRHTLETNALGPLYLCQKLIPFLRRRRAGRIINISSGMGALSSMGADYAAYRISKSTLNAITLILAAELRGSVAVNSMCPGWVRTEMGGPNAQRDVSQGADTAVWLALDAPSTLTGKFLRDRKVIPW